MQSALLANSVQGPRIFVLLMIASPALARYCLPALIAMTAVGFACAFLLAAAVTVWRYSKGKWLWNIGGCEYCLFWAICCLVLAMHG